MYMLMCHFHPPCYRPYISRATTDVHCVIILDGGHACCQTNSMHTASADRRCHDTQSEDLSTRAAPGRHRSGKQAWKFLPLPWSAPAPAFPSAGPLTASRQTDHAVSKRPLYSMHNWYQRPLHGLTVTGTRSMHRLSRGTPPPAVSAPQHAQGSNGPYIVNRVYDQEEQKQKTMVRKFQPNCVFQHRKWEPKPHSYHPGKTPETDAILVRATSVLKPGEILYVDYGDQTAKEMFGVETILNRCSSLLERGHQHTAARQT